MKSRTILPLLGLLLWLAPAASPLLARESTRDLNELGRLESKVATASRKVLPATVALLSERTGSSGSGVITSEDGLILTAAHVIQGADSMLVVFPDGKQVQGKVLGANYSKDIAMVKIQDKGKWPFVELGQSKPLEAGDWVIALGHSAGFDPARTPPVRFGRVVSKGPGNFLTTDCTLIGGDSGGPLFDLGGKLIAIHSSIGKSLSNNNHAGIDGFREDWDRILGGETWGALSLNPFANPEMPVLGIGMAMMRGLRGVVVESVVHGSPAAAAGVRTGDLITSLDGSEVRDGGELLQMLAKRQAGDQAKLGILRDRRQLEMTITLKRRSELFEGAFVLPGISSPDHEIPLLRPEEEQAVEAQTDEFNQAIHPALSEAAASTVRVWSGKRRLAYGTVIAENRILTKWSEVASAPNLRVEGAGGAVLAATVSGVYEDDDLAVLETTGGSLKPVRWFMESPALGSFLAASQPDGRPAAFGVASVLERNLRETDSAFLGVIGAMGFDGPGVRVEQITPDSGAAAAGIKPGDVILKVGNRPISGLMELKNSLVGVSPGSKITLRVRSGSKERDAEVLLGNRPDLPNFSGQRLQQMERMGGPISRVRDSFTCVIQSDMRPRPDQIGGPVADLQGRVIGITLARADRTRSFIMPAAAVQKLLETAPRDPSLARIGEPDEQPALPVRGMRAPQGGRMRQGSEEMLRRHLSEMQRLMDFMREEMDNLGPER